MDKYIHKIEKTKTCWNWKGTLSKGYGKVYVQGNKSKSAHRFIYEMLVGEIPEGFELDHLCRNRSCVNPKHLEPVTHLENVRRGLPYRKVVTHCIRGHERIPENIVTKRYGEHGKVCRLCRNIRQKLWMRKKGFIKKV